LEFVVVVVGGGCFVVGFGLFARGRELSALVGRLFDVSAVVVVDCRRFGGA